MVHLILFVSVNGNAVGCEETGIDESVSILKDWFRYARFLNLHVTVTLVYSPSPQLLPSTPRPCLLE